MLRRNSKIMKACSPVLLCLMLVVGVSSSLLAADDPWLTEAQLVDKVPPKVRARSIVMFGEMSREGKYLPVEPGGTLNARFESTVFVVVSDLDGILADVCDPSDPYWKAWRLVAEGDKPAVKALKDADLTVKEAKVKYDAALTERPAKAQDAALLAALEVQIERLKFNLDEAQKSLATLTAQVDDAKKLVSRGFKDLSVNFRLRLGGETFGKLKPLDVASLISSDKSLYLVRFSLRETNKDNEVWLRLLKNSPVTSVSCDVKLAYVNTGTAEGVISPFPGYFLRIPLFRWPFWTSFAIIGAFLYVFIHNVRTSEVLRDSGITILNRRPETGDYWHLHEHPLSMARLQMSIWFFVIIGSFVFLWSTTGSLAGVNNTALALMGISGGTSIFSAIISQKQEWDASKRAPSKTNPSRIASWFVDLLSDDQGMTIHRFQMLAWTLVLAIVFINGVIIDYAMPVFTKELLGLMGISSGVYVGFKLKEGNPRDDTKNEGGAA